MNQTRKSPTIFLLLVVAVLAIGGFAAFQFTRPANQVWRLRQQVMKAQFSKAGLKEPQATEMRRKMLRLAQAHLDSSIELDACLAVANQWPNTPEAAVARNNLLRAAKNVSIDDLATCLDKQNPRQGEPWHPFAKLLMQRVQQDPDHARAGSLLGEAAVIFDPDAHDGIVPAELLEIADLIQQKYATSSDLANFCETVSDMGNPAPWMQAFEPHLREILRVNQDRFVLSSAHYALATVVRSAGVERQDEALQLFEDYLARFDGQTQYRAHGIEQNHRQESKKYLKSLEATGLSMTGPDTQDPQ